MLKLENVKKAYGKNNALNGMTLHIEKGMLYGFIGPNGAGKTTSIKILTGLLSPDEGEVFIGGVDALKHPSDIKGMIGYVPDTFGIYDNLKVSEYMEFFAQAYGITGVRMRKRCSELLKQVGLEDRPDAGVETLSRGMQQRLCLARALIHDPEILILDEPMNGLDPGTRFEFKELIRELHDQGKTILISSHILPELSQICTNLGIVENGKMILDGSMDDIMTAIEGSNPIRISVLDGVSDALTVIKRNPAVQTISLNGKTFMLNFEGSREDEAVLLQQLINADIPVREFVREPGSLEEYFIQITDHKEEKIILENDY